MNLIKFKGIVVNADHIDLIEDAYSKTNIYVVGSSSYIVVDVKFDKVIDIILDIYNEKKGGEKND